MIAGWYPDPEKPTRHRYWDGDAWTSQVVPFETTPTPPPSGPPPSGPPPRGGPSAMEPPPPEPATSPPPLDPAPHNPVPTSNFVSPPPPPPAPPDDIAHRSGQPTQPSDPAPHVRQPLDIEPAQPSPSGPAAAGHEFDPLSWQDFKDDLLSVAASMPEPPPAAPVTGPPAALLDSPDAPPPTPTPSPPPPSQSPAPPDQFSSWGTAAAPAPGPVAHGSPPGVEPARSRSRLPFFVLAALVVVVVAGGIAWKFTRSDEPIPLTAVETVFVRNDTPCNTSGAPQSREATLSQFENATSGSTDPTTIADLRRAFQPIIDGIKKAPEGSKISIYTCHPGTDGSITATMSPKDGLIGVYNNGGTDFVFAVMIPDTSPLRKELEDTGAHVVAVKDTGAADTNTDDTSVPAGGAARPTKSADVQTCATLRTTITTAMEAWKVIDGNGQYPAGPTWKDQLVGPSGYLEDDPTAMFPFAPNPAALKGVGKCAGM